MRSFFLSLVLMLSSFEIGAQALVPLDTLVQFASTDELQASSESLRLYNPNSYPIEINAVDRFDFYGNKVFSVSDSAFLVLPGDTFSLSLSFAPEHNLMHKQALIFKSNSGFGHTAVSVQGQGIYSNSYYNVTRNKEQEPLKNALASRIALGYSSLGYTPARDNMYSSIDNSGGQVECVYTGRTASFNTRAGANNNSFNCEHTFPQGFFNSNEPMRSDIHHLFPTDVSANSTRGNKPFGIVANPTWQNGGSKSNSSTFEPRDVHKGAVARAMMYFVIRYQDYSGHFSGQEAILRQWHDQFPPTADEKSRNSAIYSLQNNRNPFVDYPQFIERISDIDGTAQANDTAGLYFSDDTIFLAQGNSGLRRYSFLIYGEGSLGGSLSNFSLNDPNLNFVNGSPGTVNVQEGEYYRLEIEFETGNAYNTSLTFNAMGQAVSIPIISGPQLSLEDSFSASVPHFFPNPAWDGISIENAEEVERLLIIDQLGRSYDMEPRGWIKLGHLPRGLYLIQFHLKNGMHYQEKLFLKP